MMTLIVPCIFGVNLFSIDLFSIKFKWYANIFVITYIKSYEIIVFWNASHLNVSEFLFCQLCTYCRYQAKIHCYQYNTDLSRINFTWIDENFIFTRILFILVLNNLKSFTIFDHYRRESRLNCGRLEWRFPSSIE